MFIEPFALEGPPSGRPTSMCPYATPAQQRLKLSALGAARLMVGAATGHHTPLLLEAVQDLQETY